jgi:hypothetical protein
VFPVNAASMHIERKQGLNSYLGQHKTGGGVG